MYKHWRNEPTSYKTLYMKEKSRKLTLKDEVKELKKENKISKGYIKRLEVRIASLKHEMKDEWLK